MFNSSVFSQAASFLAVVELSSNRRQETLKPPLRLYVSQDVPAAVSVQEHVFNGGGLLAAARVFAPVADPLIPQEPLLGGSSPVR